MVDILGRLWSNLCMTNVIPNGTAVVVSHLTGIVEWGIVRGRTKPAMPDDATFGRYDVEFAHGVRFSCPIRTVSVPVRDKWDDLLDVADDTDEIAAIANAERCM